MITNEHVEDFFPHIYHINATMLAIVDLVMPDNWAAICPDLDSCQGVTVYVISFYEASAVAKNIHASLVAIKNGIGSVFKKKTKSEKLFFFFIRL